MTKFYLWSRAWPWFLETFPFEEFEQRESTALDGASNALSAIDLDEKAIGDIAVSQALDALAGEWASKHSKDLAKERERRARALAARGRAQPTSPEPEKRRRKPTPERRSKLPGFEEIAPLAGWTLQPGGVIAAKSIREAMRPTSRIYFYRTDERDLADEILSALRQRSPRLENAMQFGGARNALLRYGLTSSDEMDPIHRALVRRGLEDLTERPDPDRAWAVRLVADTTRIESLLRTERGTSQEQVEQVSVRTIGAKPNGEAASVGKSQRDRPSLIDLTDTERAVLKALATAAQTQAARTLADLLTDIHASNLSTVDRAIKALRRRGWKIDNLRNGAGYFLVGKSLERARELVTIDAESKPKGR